MRTPTYRLTISSHHSAHIRSHSFPGDGLEAASILLCTKSSDRRLVVKKLILVPLDECSRDPHRITWPGTFLEEAIDQAMLENLSIILLHSHPGGMLAFSQEDDDSDLRTMPSLFEGADFPDASHGSAIITPDGAIRARIYQRHLTYQEVETVTCPGENITVWRLGEEGHLAARPLAFSTGMRNDLNFVTACVVGVSGTGSIVAEQLARLGIGRLILIDFDRMEIKNLNRVLNSTLQDALRGRLKTEMVAARIHSYRDDIEIHCVDTSIACRKAILAAGSADFLFCCVDSFEGRQVCDRIASAFVQPLFDVAVTIPTRQAENDRLAIADACGRIDYVYPGGSTLSDRGVYTPENLRMEYLRAAAPEDYADQVKAGYLKGTIDEAPSVISLNMRAASSCVMELIARCYPFRHEPNSHYARTLFSLAEGEEERFDEDSFPRAGHQNLARGLQEPLLGLPCFGTESEVQK